MPKKGSGVPIATRFHSKYFIDQASGCWLWRDRPSERGYGTLRIKDIGNYAHRISWELHNGPIPDGMCVCHKCDVRLCVNPDHLFLGTRIDNNLDRDRKGRHSVKRGSTVYNAKLTESDIPHIMKLCRDGKLTHKQIGAKFGVVRTLIGQINSGLIWKHVSR